MRSYVAVIGILYICVLHRSLAEPAFGLAEHLGSKTKGLIKFKPKVPSKGGKLKPATDIGDLSKYPPQGGIGPALVSNNPSGGVNPPFEHTAGNPPGGVNPPYGHTAGNPSGGINPSFAPHPWDLSGEVDSGFGQPPGGNINFVNGNTVEAAGGIDQTLGNTVETAADLEKLTIGNTAEQAVGGADNMLTNLASDTYSAGENGGISTLVNQFGQILPLGSNGGPSSLFGNYLGGRVGAFGGYPGGGQPLDYDELLTGRYYPSSMTTGDYFEEQNKLELILCIVSQCWKAKPILPNQPVKIV